MSILITIKNLTKSFGARPLFTNLNFTILEKEKIGLIGPNGAGKSTLIKILAGIDSADSGEVIRTRGLKIGLLEQVPRFEKNLTILEALLKASPDPDDWENITLAHELISHLELGKFGEEALVETLSGGWKKRVALAQALMKRPELLILDEPTNHLDVESIMWLEEFLNKQSCATLTITHDRVFLQKVSTRIIEIDPRHANGLLSVNGDYAHYLEVREQMISAQEKKEITLKNTLRREVEWLRAGVKARGTKQQARIDRAHDLQKTVADLKVRNTVKEAKLDFQTEERSPKKLIEAKNISKSYGTKTLFKNVNLLLGPKTRLGLLGKNGQGKSTLIRVLLKNEEADQGEVVHAEQLKVAYFDQARATLDPQTTVRKVVCPSGDKVCFRGQWLHFRGYLDRFMFSAEQMDFPVGKLSGGEQGRLFLAKLMLEEANVLVLDEPTNDLDVATLNVLEECLKDFNGAVILVTHDRYFLDQVATQILAFSPVEGVSELTSFASLFQWEAWHERVLEDARQGTGKTSSQNDEGQLPTQNNSTNKKKKLSYKETQELATMEETIHTWEKKLKSLEQALTDEAVIKDHQKFKSLSDEIAQTQKQIERLYERWSELSG